jgi:hypothetical protein
VLPTASITLSTFRHLPVALGRVLASAIFWLASVRACSTLRSVVAMALRSSGLTVCCHHARRPTAASAAVAAAISLAWRSIEVQGLPLSGWAPRRMQVEGFQAVPALCGSG